MAPRIRPFLSGTSNTTWEGSRVYLLKGRSRVAATGNPSQEQVVSIRPVTRITEAVPTMEGAGVRLRRAFGFNEKNELDPFLLFDDFSSRVSRRVLLEVSAL